MNLEWSPEEQAFAEEMRAIIARGDQVDVLAPERLRQMIKGHRRADFPSLP